MGNKNQPGGTQNTNQGKGQKLEQATKALQKNSENQSNSKIQLVNSVTELQADRTAIIDRLNVVLAELDTKGGDSKSYREFIKAVSAVKVNVDDSQGMIVRITGWFKSSEGGLRWGQNAGKFLGIVLIFFIGSNLLAEVVRIFLKSFGRTSRVFREFVVVVIKRGGLVVGVMLGLTALEISFGPILALLGGVSFILAFALQTNLSNFASGLLILAYKPFDVGDEIQINSITGEVESINLANTNIIKRGGDKVIIPNNSVWNSTILNMTSKSIRSLKIVLEIDLRQDMSVTEKLLLETAKSHPDILSEPVPNIAIAKIESYYARVVLITWTKPETNWKTNCSLNRMIIDKFQKEGVALGVSPLV